MRYLATLAPSSTHLRRPSRQPWLYAWRWERVTCQAAKVRVLTGGALQRYAWNTSDAAVCRFNLPLMVQEHPLATLTSLEAESLLIASAWDSGRRTSMELGVLAKVQAASDALGLSRVFCPSLLQRVLPLGISSISPSASTLAEVPGNSEFHFAAHWAPRTCRTCIFTSALWIGIGSEDPSKELQATPRCID